MYGFVYTEIRDFFGATYNGCQSRIVFICVYRVLHTNDFWYSCDFGGRITFSYVFIAMWVNNRVRLMAGLDVFIVCALKGLFCYLIYILIVGLNCAN